MNDPLLHQGLDLLLYGMGTVFAFLALLVAVTSVMSAIVAHFSPPKEVSHATLPAASHMIDDHLLAIIQQALNQHRRRK